MAIRFNGSTAGLFRSGQLVTAYPFTVFAWTRATTAKVGFVAELAIDPGPRGTHEGHGMLADGSRMRAWSTVGSSVSAYSSRAETLNDWVPCMVVFASASLRRIYYGTGAVQSESTSVPQNAALLNAFSIGRQAVANANYFAGDIGSVGIWGSELAAADFATLSGGAVPSTVQPGTLIEYWSLLTQATSQTGLNGRVLTATATTQAPTHPISESAGAPDTTAPALTGAITVSNLVSTGYTLSWPTASDNVAVAGYEYSLDGGATWADVGTATSATVSGRTPGATDQVQVRARDAAGNRSTPALSTAVPLPAATDTTPPTLGGALTISALTSTSYTVAWPAGSDNVGVTSYDVSLDGGTTWGNVGNVLAANVSGRTPGATDAVRVRARDATGNVSTPALSASVTLLPAPDGTAPTLAGTVTVSNLTTTGYTLTWPAASDNVGVTSYERSLDGGGTWSDVGNVLTSTVSGRTPGATDQIRIRAKDAAGNTSTPLATTATLPSAGAGSFSTPPLKNNTGTVLASLTGLTVNVYNATSGALIVQKRGLTSDAAGVVVVSDSTLVAGTSYAYEVVTPSVGRRLPLASAT